MAISSISFKGLTMTGCYDEKSQKIYGTMQNKNASTVGFVPNIKARQPHKDMVCFTSSKNKRASREAEAKKLLITERFNIPLNDITMTHINAVKLGLDPKTTKSYQIRAAQLGLDPINTTEKEVHLEPSKRELEIDAKLLGISTQDLSLNEIQKRIDQAKRDIYLIVIKDVLGEVPEGCKPLTYANFDNVFPCVATIDESLQLIAEALPGLKDSALAAAKKIGGSKSGNLSDERRLEILKQNDDIRQKIYQMEQQFNQRILGIKEQNPDPETLKQKQETVWRLKCKGSEMKRREFESKLSSL